MKNKWKFLVFWIACASFLTSASAQQQTDSSPAGDSNPKSTTTQKDTTDKKTKKVWTDDDLHGLGGVSVVGDSRANSKGRSSTNKDGTAADYKQQLAKLQAQLDDIDKKLSELRSFNGDNGKDTAIQTNHRLSRGSISDQIAQLETKKADVTERMQKIYDEARHKGIEPGALR
jgi:phage major head subunit gpT-like protein